MAVKVISLREWDINQIVNQIGQPGIKAVIFFFSPSYERVDLQKELADAFPQAVCIGSSMYGGWSSDGAIRTGITIMSLSCDEVEEAYVSFQEGVKKDPIKTAHAAIAELKYKTAGHNINPDEYLGLIFFDGLCLGELIMKEFTMEKSLNMAFIGGAAADEMTFTRTLVCGEDKISSDGLVAAILKMKIPFFFNHYVHFLPTENSFTLTRVEIMQRIAWEINGEPAAEFYARQLGVDDVSKLTFDYFVRHPVGLILGDSIYIRSPNHVVDGKGLQFYCYIEAGTKVFMLKQGDIIANAKGGVMGASQFLPGIQGCLLFNCIQRYLELVEKEKINEFNDVFSEYPMIGFNTYGEELFTHHNQTLTAVFFGTLPEAGMTDPFKTKRLFHYTDSKLKSLVFDIVSRSELLNITISYLKRSIDSETNETVLANYENIREYLEAMIEQSNISKDDIERMLVVYQNNVEKTGEYVFKIVDEIRAQNQKLVELREEAEIASRTKSNFLASMSHEIRTPMNAITGMAELLLRTSLSEEARNYAQDIKQAGSNLITIINDILDFSKIEAGKVDIIVEKYLFSSLINDTINIICARLREKPLYFCVNIDGQIPGSLYGDVARIRQILLNLLSNAVKFTERGHISLTVTIKNQSDKNVWLKFTVADTGKGITPGDQTKLFGEFVQVDLKRNRNVEGTGLGLAITKRLCINMSGDIRMESEYGKGSVFTAIIPQIINSHEPVASVRNAKTRNVLVLEGRSVYAKSICWSLENLGVRYTAVANISDFSDALDREEWTAVFFCSSLYRMIKNVLNNYKKSILVMMTDWGSQDHYFEKPEASQQIYCFSMPIHSLTIANILNGKEDSRYYQEDLSENRNNRNTFPKARILIVDDIRTNLKVTEGLLSAYQSKVDTCLSGQEAIDLVKKNEYDIIFMDHMMPEMDGIEATTIIREWEEERNQQLIKDSKQSLFYQIPIIALTANAVSGVREMFIEKGFDDFLAKPIDVSALDEILNRWMPKEKTEKEFDKNKPQRTDELTGLAAGKSLDVEMGIKITGGSKARYNYILSAFRDDAQERILQLRNLSKEKDLSAFVTQIHALKSASASIAAQEVSAQAGSLESAGMKGDRAFINDYLDRFIGHLSGLVKEINIILGENIDNRD